MDFVRINILQEDNSGFFKGIAPADLLAAGKKGQVAVARFVFALRTLLRYNVYVQALLKVTQKKKEGATKKEDNLKCKTFEIEGTQLKEFE